MYPDPGSNRDGSPHRCLRPARLPIPPSGHFVCKVTSFPPHHQKNFPLPLLHPIAYPVPEFIQAASFSEPSVSPCPPCEPSKNSSAPSAPLRVLSHPIIIPLARSASPSVPSVPLCDIFPCRPSEKFSVSPCPPCEPSKNSSAPSAPLRVLSHPILIPLARSASSSVPSVPLCDIYPCRPSEKFSVSPWPPCEKFPTARKNVLRALCASV